MTENHSPEPRYYGCYRDGYYVVIDQPSEPNSTMEGS